MKTRIITWLITLGAFLDTMYGVLSDNSGLLIELGVSQKVTKVVLMLGILWTAFSKSLKPEQVQNIVGGNVPPTKDEK